MLAKVIPETDFALYSCFSIFCMRSSGSRTENALTQNDLCRDRFNIPFGVLFTLLFTFLFGRDRASAIIFNFPLIGLISKSYFNICCIHLTFLDDSSS